MKRRFIQPDILKTDSHVPYSGGKGNEVWNMLEACTTGKFSLVRELLENDPALSNCSWAYFTPLHFAVREGHTEIVRLLLQYGADATAKSGLGWQDTPLQKALDRGHHRIAQILEDHLQRTFHSNSLGESMAALIRERNESEIKRRVDENPDVLHSSDERGNTPLHWAVLTRQLKLIDFFIEKGADLQAKRADGSQAVHLAMEGDYFYRSNRDLPAESIQNRWFLLGYLISKGAVYDICIAAAIGDTQGVRGILEQDARQANAKDSSGRSALYYAAKHGHAQTVKVLLEYGADPNQAEKDAPHGAALHAAASGNHLSCAKLLLAHGANPNAEVEASGNPVSIAMHKGYKEMQELLYAYGGTATLTAACWLGKMDLVGEILAVHPSAANEGGDYGPLAQAAGSGHESIVRLLLKHGADLNRPWYASNYMVYACRYSGKAMVERFLDHGADPNLSNWLGVSYLHLLALQGNTELAAIMMDYGADVNAVDDEYCTTPLGWAAKYGQAEMAALLLERGAQRDPAGVPEWAKPIAWAKRKGHSAIVKMLS